MKIGHMIETITMKEIFSIDAFKSWWKKAASKLSESFLDALVQGLLKCGQDSSDKIFKLFSVSNYYAKPKLKFFVAMPIGKLPTNFQINIFIFWGQSKPSKFTLVIEAKIQKVGPGREFLWQISELFCMIKYAKTVSNLFVAMLNRKLRTNFQFNIFQGKPSNFSHWSKMLIPQISLPLQVI